MKLNMKVTNYLGSVIGVVLAATSSVGHASPAPAQMIAPGKFYVGAFGGGASAKNFDINQYGTALFPEDVGGPLAVNAFGGSDHPSKGFIGAQVGYQGMAIFLNPNNPSWAIAPAAELEGLFIGNTTFSAHDINNNTTRLPEHDFSVTYPTRVSVFLTNAVVSLSAPQLGRFHPYVGVGLGGAIVSISGATATQISPPEVGINHFNANASDATSAFAAQAKVGLNVDVVERISVFIEYRWLYIASTQFLFGSTVYPTHVPTSSWQVTMDSRSYNVGAIGIQLSV
jgi:opacity protein-like surface antigen